MARKKLSEKVESELLMVSARKCCLCFGLNHDLNEKAGQIAHLDQDATNNAIDNLAWLCLPHHDKYDSRSRQSKGYKEIEVKEYRAELYKFVSRLRNDTQQKYQEMILQTYGNGARSGRDEDELLNELSTNQKNTDFPLIREKGGKISDFIPNGWKIIANAKGDLQNIGQGEDFAVVIQSLDSENVRIWENFGLRSLDANPRILFIVLRKGHEYFLVGQSNTFILSHEEFNMTDPFQSIEISNRRLQVDFELFSSMGSWSMSTASYWFQYWERKFILVEAQVTDLHRASGDFEKRDFNFSKGEVKVTSGNMAKDDEQKEEIVLIDKDRVITLQNFIRPFELELDECLIL